MSERKPPGMTYETWAERQIREAQERGEFDDLPGAGEPIPGLDGTYDELWWVRDKLRRERLSYLPPSLALRKEVEDARRDAVRARSEAEARRLVDEVNAKVRAAIRMPPPGPLVVWTPLDVDAVLAEWREQHRGPRG